MKKSEESSNEIFYEELGDRLVTMLKWKGKWLEIISELFLDTSDYEHPLFYAKAKDETMASYTVEWEAQFQEDFYVMYNPNEYEVVKTKAS